MEAAWQFTSRALKILRLCWIQQAFLESLLHAGPYTRWSSLRCSCARSGKGSQLGSRHFPHSAGRCCASGKHEGHGAPQKAYQPRLEKGMPGSVLKVVTQRKLVEGPSMELSSTGCCVSGTYQRRRGREGVHVLVLNRRGRAGGARSGPQPKMSLISAWCSQPHQDGSRQGHRQYTGCSFSSACSSTSVSVLIAASH